MGEPKCKRDYLNRISEMLVYTDDVLMLEFIYKLLKKTAKLVD